jgi:hypothetical protein
MISKLERQKAGHYEILGETLAKFEFFQAGWNPYERYLDVDKVDLILRRRQDQRIIYREIQVKYGKLYDMKGGKAHLFDRTSWRFFNPDEFVKSYNRPDFFIAYVLAHDTGYSQDIFIFPPKVFGELIGQAILSVQKRKVYISRSRHDNARWFLRKLGSFSEICDESCVEVTQYRRAFNLLEPE